MNSEILYRIEPAKDGNPVLIVSDHGRDIPLHSRINPVREGLNSGFNPDPGKYDLLIVLGCGLGYHLAGLKGLSGSFRSIVIIDAIKGIEQVLAGNVHSSFLLDDVNIIFLTGKQTGEIIPLLQELIRFDEVKGVQVYEHPQSVRLFAGYYGEIRSAIRGVIDRKAADAATVRAFGNLFLKNCISNLRNTGMVSPVSAMRGKFTGCAALIVSSAPSLGDNICDVGRIRESACIIAVDSAIPVLEHYGIVPDFSVSIDPQARIHEHFIGHKGGATAHVFSISSPPELVRRYGGYLSLNSHPVSQVMDEFFPGVIGSIDSATGTVAGDALRLAVLAGFDTIGMTGFDFSFSENIIYARGTAYQNRYSMLFNNRFITPESFNAYYIFRSSGSFMLEGKYSRRSFAAYRDSLDRLIATDCSKGPYIINRRGLPLSNGQVSGPEVFTGRDILNRDSTVMTDMISGRFPVIDSLVSTNKAAEFLLKDGVFDEFISSSCGGDVSPGFRGRIRRLIESIRK